MKNILKRIFIPIFASVVFGFVCGKIIYSIYLKDTTVLDKNIVYLIQSGTYNSYDNMRENSIGDDYVYYKEDDLYKTVVGVVKSEENIDKIKSLYDVNLEISKYYIEDEDINSKLIELDNELSSLENENAIKEIGGEMLNLYKGENSIKLIKIS